MRNGMRNGMETIKEAYSTYVARKRLFPDKIDTLSVWKLTSPEVWMPSTYVVTDSMPCTLRRLSSLSSPHGPAPLCCSLKRINFSRVQCGSVACQEEDGLGDICCTDGAGTCQTAHSDVLIDGSLLDDAFAGAAVTSNRTALQILLAAPVCKPARHRSSSVMPASSCVVWNSEATFSAYEAYLRLIDSSQALISDSAISRSGVRVVMSEEVRDMMPKPNSIQEGV